MRIYRGSINVEKIDKKRLYKGDKGTYLNFSVVVRDEPDQFGNDGFVAEDISKEERESGQKGTILGNVRKVEKRQTEQPDPQPAQQDDDLPF